MLPDTGLKEQIRKRWNEAAEDFDDLPGHGLRTMQEKQTWMSLLQKTLGPKPLKILDVGTGTGVIALLLTEMGHNVTGIDLSEDMLARAREKARKANMPVEFLEGDAENVPFPDKTFEAVINRHVLWTLPNPEKAVSEWIRVLKPGGCLVIIDGDWSHYGLFRKTWRRLANVLILLTEKRNPWSRQHRFLPFENDLPMRKAPRPQADIDLLGRYGVSAEVYRFKDPRSYHLLGFLKYGYYNRFIVTGIKSAGR